MKPILVYLAQASLCLAVFYLAYELFLKRETFFRLNRVYLVSGLWFSLLIPAFPITSPFRTLTVPASGDFSSLPFAPSGGFGWGGVLIVLYGAGVFFFLLRFGLQLLKLRRVVRTYGIRRLRGVKIVAVERLFSPFSFFDIIFLNPGASLDANLRRILAHEQVHIRQQHTLDVLLMEVVLSLQWFNPFVWPYKKALQETHEYLADSGVIAQGFSSVRYQLHMFEQNVGASLFEFGNNFKKSQIKRRILMLSKMKSPGPARLKVLVALPLVVLLVLAFAQPRLVAGPATAQDSKQKEIQVKEDLARLAALEQDIRKQLETAPNDAAKKELAMKLEKVMKKRQELTGSAGVTPNFSPAEFEAMAKELKEKEAAVKTEFEKTTDEAKKAELKKTLMMIQQKKESLKVMFAKAKGEAKPVEFSTDQMKKMMAELQAKEADARQKLAGTTDPSQKAELEALLQKIQNKQIGLKAEFEKARAAGKSKEEKTAK